MYLKKDNIFTHVLVYENAAKSNSGSLILQLSICSFNVKTVCALESCVFEKIVSDTCPEPKPVLVLS